jgi:hypothetical protein
MLKNTHFSWHSALLITGLFLVSGCDKNFNSEPGTLEGVISIGPLCPLQKDPPDPGCLPTRETYNAYPVAVFSPRGTKITRIDPALDGSYETSLEPGHYFIVLETNHSGISSSNLPAEVVITSKDKKIFNINIDTGIR